MYKRWIFSFFTNNSKYIVFIKIECHQSFIIAHLSLLLSFDVVLSVV